MGRRGSRFRKRYAINLRAGGLLVASLFVVTSVCYLITNGSFYWLGSHVANPDFAGWMQNLTAWYPYFLQVTFAYVGIAAVLHLLVLQLNHMRTGTATKQTSA